MRTSTGLLAVLGAAALLAACQQVAPHPGPPVAATTLPVYEASPAGTDVYRLDPAVSKVTIYVYRAGAAARFGHDHVLDVPQLEGWAALDGDDPQHARFALRFALDALRVDDATLRAATGGVFSGTRPAADIAGTRANMLKSLEALRYPEVVLRSDAVRGDWPWLVADVTIGLHGLARRTRVVLHVVREAGMLCADGRIAIRQSDFGITPFSVLGGALAVADDIAVDFSLQLRAS